MIFISHTNLCMYVCILEKKLIIPFNHIRSSLQILKFAIKISFHFHRRRICSNSYTTYIHMYIYIILCTYISVKKSCYFVSRVICSFRFRSNFCYCSRQFKLCGMSQSNFNCNLTFLELQKIFVYLVFLDIECVGIWLQRNSCNFCMS